VHDKRLGKPRDFHSTFIVGSMVRALHAAGTRNVILPNGSVTPCSTQENEAANAQNPPCGHRVLLGVLGD